MRIGAFDIYSFVGRKGVVPVIKEKHRAQTTQVVLKFPWIHTGNVQDLVESYRCTGELVTQPTKQFNQAQPEGNLLTIPVVTKLKPNSPGSRDG